MKLLRLACAATLLACSTLLPAWAQALLEPPPDAQKFAIVSRAGRHGTGWHWQLADGSQVVRESILLRGHVWEHQMVAHPGEGGRPDRVVVSGKTPEGDAAETFAVEQGIAQWKSQVDSGSARWDGASLYVPAGGTWATRFLSEALWRASGRELPLLPSGKARLTRLADVQVGSGANAVTVTSWAMEGFGLEPIPVLLDAQGRFFGWAGGMAYLPEAYAGEHLRLQKVQIDALAARQPEIARRFLKMPGQAVAFAHVKLFDADAGRFLEDQTVVVEGATIAAVGPSASVSPPQGARVIEGRGMTLVPGLWDSHMHTGSDAQGAMLLSLGETSARDPGADVQGSLLRFERIARGELLYPTVHASVLIDGKGPLAAQGGVSVASQQEAIDTVRMAKAKGFRGVKFYGSFDPKWLAPSVAEAHKLGLHVHGHIPATLRTRDAIAAGYDEITHINFVLMQAMPDSVVNASNGLARFDGPGTYGKDVDLDKEPMASLIRDMAARHIAVDPTLVVFENLLTKDKGQVSAAYVDFKGTLPPSMERDFLQGSKTLPPGVTREDFRASFRKMMELTRRLDAAGVPIVAGTDGGGLEIVRELELYVEAGMTPAQALRTATINPARLVGVDKTTGSIAVGKSADLVLVEGDPSRRIGELRNTRWVMQKGALMNADELREVAGFSGRPKTH